MSSIAGYPMTTFLFIVNVLCAIALTVLVLMQKTEGGALGIGGAKEKKATTRTANSVHVRFTWIFGIGFLVSSFGLTVVYAYQGKLGGSLMRKEQQQQVGDETEIQSEPALDSSVDPLIEHTNILDDDSGQSSDDQDRQVAPDDARQPYDDQKE